MNRYIQQIGLIIILVVVGSTVLGSSVHYANPGHHASSHASGQGDPVTGALSLAGLTVDTNVLHVDPTNNRVGIGTITPGQTLDVAGNIMVPSSGIIYFGDLSHYIDQNPSTALRFITYSGDFSFGRVTDGLKSLYLKGSGNVGVGTETFGTSAAKVVGIANGTAPSTSPADMIQLWAEDVVASSELRVRDEAGNVTTLSPHPAEFLNALPNDTDHALPWAYHSKNEYLGKEVYVDMGALAREVEKLSGKTFVTLKSIPQRQWVADKDYEKIERDKKLKETWANEHKIMVALADAIEEIVEETEDRAVIVGEKTEYDVRGGDIVSVKIPVYTKKMVTKKQLKSGVTLDKTTGKLYRLPTEAEIKQAVVAGKLKLWQPKAVPQWLQVRGVQ